MQLAPLFPVLHQILKPVFPGCLWTGSQQRTEIALTFDDGPHPQYTPALLEVLEHYNVTASFFWLGACVQRSPTVARLVYEQGHWLGLHGYDHQSFPTLSPTNLKQSLEKTQAAIAKACNLSPNLVRDVRPPNGLFTPQTLQLLNRWRYRAVMWSVVPEDWVSPGISVVCQRVLKQTVNGSIIVLHDGYAGGEEVAAAAARIIPVLLSEGYRFVSIKQLWDGCDLNRLDQQ